MQETIALGVDHWPWEQTCAVRGLSAKLACYDMMEAHAFRNICIRSVGGLRRLTASSLLGQGQSQQQQRQSTYLDKSVMHSAVGTLRGQCTPADDTLPEARKVLHFWYTCKHCFEAPSTPSCLLAISHCHVYRLGDDYAEAKANSFPAGQKKLWFMGGPKVDQVNRHTGKAEYT